MNGDGPSFAPLCLDALTVRIAEASGFKEGYLAGGALGYATAETPSEDLISGNFLIRTR